MSTLTEGHEAVSESLEYEAAANKYTFTGRPFVLRMRDKDGRCSQSMGNFGTLSADDRLVEIPPGPRNPAETYTNSSVRCSDPLKP
jgi:hypothetical protein